MADVKSFKIETPKNLDSIFSLDCFKYNEMKGLFKQIYEYLTRVGLKIDDIDKQLNSIPNFDGVTQSIKDLEKRVTELATRTRNNEQMITSTNKELLAKIDSNYEQLSGRDNSLEKRIAILEEEVEALKKRPVSTGTTQVEVEKIDYSKLASAGDV